MRATAGTNRAGEPGFAQIADCVTGAEGPGMSVELGWSKNPNAAVNWRGGLVSGIIAPDRKSRLRLVAASAPPGSSRARRRRSTRSPTTTAPTRCNGSCSR